VTISENRNIRITDWLLILEYRMVYKKKNLLVVLVVAGLVVIGKGQPGGNKAGVVNVLKSVFVLAVVLARVVVRTLTLANNHNYIFYISRV